MSSSDSYILITDSHDLNDDTNTSDTKPQEGEDASRRTLESQGISIIGDIDSPVRTESLDQFSRELMNEGGIEIVSGDEEE